MATAVVETCSVSDADPIPEQEAANNEPTVVEDKTWETFKENPAAAAKFTSEEPGSLKYYREWLSKLQESMFIPSIDKEEVWRQKLRIHQDSRGALEKAKHALNEARKREDSEEMIQILEQAVARAQQSVEDAHQQYHDMAKSILQESPDFQNFLQANDTEQDDLWVTWSVIASASTRKEWFRWSQENSQEMLPAILDMLHSPDFLREILENGGPRHNNYKNFLKIYHQLHAPMALDATDQEEQHPVLRRLAMAVALEFAQEKPVFDQDKVLIDPIQRYVHYEQAFLLGELDPAFPTFSVWELRMVVDSDASDEQLAWGRRSLMNYRPDLILSTNDQWRYNMIVKTDVPHRAPDWYKQPRSYDQILSGGGKCGPRAWYGRFICKAFGIPTWGFRQAGHAAMSRWTPGGWVTCLGAAFKFAFWEKRIGLDFKLEADTRRACGTDAKYRQQVQRLKWLAFLKGDERKSLKDGMDHNPKQPWMALMLLQCEMLIAASVQQPSNTPLQDTTNTSASATESSEESQKVMSKIQRMKNQGAAKPGVPAWDPKSKTLSLPADCCSNPSNGSNKERYHPSFLGGRQMFLSADGILEYTLTPEVLPVATVSPKQFLFSIRFCSVHRAEKDMKVTITTALGDSKEYMVPLPYTMGEWEYTDPVKVDIGGTGVTQIKMTRTHHGNGISIKEMKLSLVEES